MECKVQGCREQVLSDCDRTQPSVMHEWTYNNAKCFTFAFPRIEPKERYCYYHQKVKDGLIEGKLF